MTESSIRRDWLSRPIFRWARSALPSLSATEREAIEAGDVWWDADLFSGNPDWAKLLATPPAQPRTRTEASSMTPPSTACVGSYHAMVSNRAALGRLCGWPRASLT